MTFPKVCLFFNFNFYLEKCVRQVKFLMGKKIYWVKFSKGKSDEISRKIRHFPPKYLMFDFPPKFLGKHKPKSHKYIP